MTDDGKVIVSRDPTPSNTPRPGAPVAAEPIGTSTSYGRGATPGRWFVLVGLVVLLGIAGVIAGALLRGPANALPRVARGSAETTTAPDGPPVANTSPEITLAGGSVVGTTAITTGPNRVTAKGVFDPPPGDGIENPAQLNFLTDNDSSSEWTTVCYDNDQMRPKIGVGLVFELVNPSAGNDIEVFSKTNGWAATVYVAPNVGTALADWGEPVSVGSAIPAGSASFSLGNNPGRYVLVWFTHLGRSGTCKLPFQMRVSEVRVVKRAAK